MGRLVRRGLLSESRTLLLLLGLGWLVSHPLVAQARIDAAQLLQLGQQRLVAGVLKDWHELGVAELPFAHHYT
ncbi:hypothetical protein HaLaN_20746, partial [Haematococcus lacustris]